MGDRDVIIQGRFYTRTEAERRFGDLDPWCGFRSTSCNDGLEAGTRLLSLWTARGLQLDIVPDRAMDLGCLRYKGIPLTWSSGTGYVHPSYLQDLGWPGGFHGGLLATCGVNNVGPACEEEGVRHEQHGRISRLPASGVSCRAEWLNDSLLLIAEGVVDDRDSRGYHMKLSRKIVVDGDAHRIRLIDRVTNLGLDTSVCMLQYHMNFGFPLIDDETELIAPYALGEKRISMAALTPDIDVRPIPCAEEGERGEAALISRALGLELVVRYSRRTLPHLWRWHDLRDRRRVFAIEPSNCAVKPRSAAGTAGALPTLVPGESREFDVEVEIRERHEAGRRGSH